MSSSVTLQAAGLNYSPNLLSLPPGSMIEANDVIISRDNVLESRRGYREYVTGLGTSTDYPKQLMEYKNRILVHYSDFIAFDTGNLNAAGKSIFDNFAGTYLEPQAGTKIKWIEAVNKNLYFTSSTGIQKISASSNTNFNDGTVEIGLAGAVKALDLTATLKIVQGQISGFLPPDSAVAYRALWGYKDNNKNLLLGDPSERVELYNYLSDIIALDLNKLTLILDNLNQTGSLINDGNYSSSYYSGVNPNVSALANNVIALATQLDQDIQFVNQGGSSPLQIANITVANNVVTITFSSGNPSLYISVNDFIQISGINTASSVSISSITPGNPTIINTSAPHGLVDGAQVTISGTNTNLDGVQTVTTSTAGFSSSQFSIPINTLVAINSVTFGTPNTLVTTTAAHGFQTGNTIAISGTNTTPSINGNQVITVTSTNAFTVAIPTTASGTMTSPIASPVISSGTVALPSLFFANGNWQVTGVDTTTLTFLYALPSTVTPSANQPSSIDNLTATIPNTGTLLNSYNYENITNTGDDIQNVSLVDTDITVPATNGEETVIEHTINRIANRLKLELNAVIPTALLTEYVTPYNITTAANAEIKVTIPPNINSTYFLQIYRTRTFTASDTQTLGGSAGIPVVPDDEMRLVFEYFPTGTDLTNGYVTFLDETPESLVENNTNLYTNPESGEGINQQNDPPPFALDINQFKNVLFYANTRTPQSIPTFQLLGVANIADGDKLTIASSSGSLTYTFVTGVNQITSITIGTAPTDDEYFIIYSAENETKYYVYYEVDNSGSTGPTQTDGINVKVSILSTDNTTVIASKTTNTINGLIFDFSSTSSTNVVSIINENEGITNNATAGTTTFTVTTSTPGNGENAATRQVLKSNLISAAQAIEETARSLVRVINKQSTSVVSAYYISSDTSPPGQIVLQSKNLDPNPFYVLTSDSGLGSSFNPDSSPDFTNITSISVANPTVVTTSSSHGLSNVSQIVISGSDSTPSIDGVYTVTVLSPTTFSIPVHVTVAGTKASWSLTTDTTVSTNDVNINRIYYSKLNQPEAVPILNYFDVGAGDKAILRIFPLRDTLFVLKEDGLFRVSGENAPFVLDLFDTSCVLIAPETVAVSNNYIYAWTLKGLTQISETGAKEVSRPIDTEILKISSNSYSNFKTISWGAGYDSDNSYIVYTNANPSDTVPTLAYRYCTLTNTWTNFNRTQTCGLVTKFDDKMYIGSGLASTIHQERKNFDRTDYADTDFTVDLADDGLASNNILSFTSVADIVIGDVITQEQSLSLYQFNKLLTQLDLDPTTEFKNYSDLTAIPGDNMRTKIVALAAKLDIDTEVQFNDYSARIAAITGTITSNSISTTNTQVNTTSPSNLVNDRLVTITGTQTPASIPPITGTYEVGNTGIFGTSTSFSLPIITTTAGGTGLTYSTANNLNTFDDIQACYNEIVNRLNSDPGTTFKNYPVISGTTLFEAVVTSVDYRLNRITVNLNLQWVVGEMIIYNAIDCQVVWAPCTFGDPLMTKQVAECTLMFDNRAFTNAIVSFASDMLPEFLPVPVLGDGNGIFGHYSKPGFGYGFFGGSSNSAPFRTFVPRQAQRCRYINVMFEHSIAREKWSIYGVTLSGREQISIRGYR